MQERLSASSAGERGLGRHLVQSACRGTLPPPPPAMEGWMPLLLFQCHCLVGLQPAPPQETILDSALSLPAWPSPFTAATGGCRGIGKAACKRDGQWAKLEQKRIKCESQFYVMGEGWGHSLGKMAMAKKQSGKQQVDEQGGWKKRAKEEWEVKGEKHAARQAHDKSTGVAVNGFRGAVHLFSAASGRAAHHRRWRHAAPAGRTRAWQGGRREPLVRAAAGPSHRGCCPHVQGIAWGHYLAPQHGMESTWHEPGGAGWVQLIRGRLGRNTWETRNAIQLETCILIFTPLRRRTCACR